MVPPGSTWRRWRPERASSLTPAIVWHHCVSVCWLRSCRGLGAARGGPLTAHTGGVSGSTAWLTAESKMRLPGPVAAEAILLSASCSSSRFSSVAGSPSPAPRRAVPLHTAACQPAPSSRPAASVSWPFHRGLPLCLPPWVPLLAASLLSVSCSTSYVLVFVECPTFFLFVWP